MSVTLPVTILRQSILKWNITKVQTDYVFLTRRSKGMETAELEWDVEGARGPCGLEKARPSLSPQRTECSHFDVSSMLEASWVLLHLFPLDVHEEATERGELLPRQSFVRLLSDAGVDVRHDRHAVDLSAADRRSCKIVRFVSIKNLNLE